MDWYIHHVNVPSHDIALARAFYRDVIGLVEGEWTYPAAEQLGQVGHNRDTLAYFGTGNRGLHVVKPIVTFTKDNGFFHNPTVGGHFAITVADLEAVMQRLDEAGILYSDARTYAMAGVHQIYLYEPGMKVLEINQIVDERAGPPPRRGEQHSMREEPGGWSLHHVNMQAFDVRQTAAFLSHIIGIREGAWDYPDSLQMGGTGRSNAALATFGEGYLGIHAVKPMVEFAKNNNLTHNPTIGGHFAITVPDVTVVMERLKAAGIPFDDAGSYAMKGMRQVYTFDPSMNFVEINQVV
ncbi:MAG: VOC family protein [Hyphomicrobiaceae bacterium]|nr:VOC family protein [Hyphomicrobiaceae bacterium]